MKICSLNLYCNFFAIYNLIYSYFAFFDTKATLYAKWTRNSITLATPTREGYELKGWFTAKSGGTQITSASEIKASQTIYAQWEQTANIMMSGPNFTRKISSIADEVTEIEFLATLPDLSGYTLGTNKWDVSDAQNGRVMAWYEGTKLRIGANGPIIANKDCSEMFFLSVVVK